MNNSTLSDSDEGAGRTASAVVLNVATLIGFWGMLITFGVAIFVIILRYLKQKCVQYSSAANEDADSIEVEIQLDGIDHAVFSNFPTYTYAQLPSPAAAASGCTVCLENYREGQVARLLPPCGHVFHRSCIDPWLMSHSTCPICRRTTTTTCTPN